ncbi:MAG: hypothetical protein K2I45_09255 [Muribaculaceae bacterium]|nr:hypothetical protein [Muribaculaceae bacterium]
MMKFFKTFAIFCMAVLTTVSVSSCSDDKKEEPTAESALYGVWENVYDEPYDDVTDVTTIVFNKDNSGYITENIETRAGLSYKMEFDWSATVTSTGATRLTIVYKSGDRGEIEPFTGKYAQWTNQCTVAGSTLTINTSDSSIMIFKKK